MSKRKEVKAISVIFAFIQSLFMVLLVTIVVFYGSFLSPVGITRNFERSGYYEEVFNATLERIYDVLIPTGLPSDIFEGVFELETFQKNTYHFTRSELRGNEYSFDTQAINQALNQNILVFIQQEGLSDTVHQDTIDEIINAVITIYENGMTLPFIETMSQYIGYYRQMMMFLAPTSIAIIGFCMFMMYKVNKWKHRLIRYQAYTLGSTALIIMVGPLLLKVWGGYEQLIIQPEHFNNFIIFHINSTLNLFITIGIILLVSEIAFAYFSEVKRKHTVKEVKDRRKMRRAFRNQEENDETQDLSDILCEGDYP